MIKRKNNMKLKFDPNQDFQIDAVNAIVDVFEGQPRQNGGAVRVAENTGGGRLNLATTFGVYPNELNLTPEEIVLNLHKVQERNNLETTGGNFLATEGDDYLVAENGSRMLLGADAEDVTDFSIEMETGTGKTYVYLRTLFELHKKYGWKKFIILVPSVAIREGVVKTLEITREHFSALYDNVPYRFYEYQSKNISQVKRFADSSNIEIMVMTVQSFRGDDRVLNKTRDQMHGEKPITYIQNTRPILILDEPQNMEGEATKEALKNFNALFRLRYSATHKIPYNVVYQLTPADAYQKGLVKKIEVFSVVDDDSGISRPYISVIAVKSGKTAAAMRASVEVVAKDAKGNLKKKKMSLGPNDDVAKKTGNDAYAGYVVEALDADAPDYGQVGKIKFTNGVEITQGENVGGNRAEIMREQISETVRLHLEKRQKMREMDIKVLSLFFIDKVANYTADDGAIRRIFSEEFERQKGAFGLSSLSASAVHKGYFAKRGDEFLEREKSISENAEAYELIMKDKERLLSFDEPTEFIFSHSALKEGWDNPNIFNICTLRETQSAMRKRQEIGRGMRLCVNQDGERVFLKEVNLLSVVANESYADYVAQLQGEFVEDGIYTAPPSPHNARRKTTVKLKKDFEKSDGFAELWERIAKKTRYFVRVDTERLVERAAKRIGELSIKKPQVRIERARVDIGGKGISGGTIGTDERVIKQEWRVVDCIEAIKNETKLTRDTVAGILLAAQNTKSFLNNPEKFCFEAAKIIKEELLKDYVERIRYEIVADRFKTDAFESKMASYKDAVQPVGNSIYDAIVFDSGVEQKFAIELDKDERVKLFIKLPSWFKIETPLGSYNPDWAIVTAKQDLSGKEASERVYFVIETKGNVANLRPSEAAKIASAKKHFEVIAVNYKEVDNFEQFANLI